MWLEGLPGAGKSTLVASYLAYRETPALWYHIDETDHDIATFFVHFAQAAAANLPGQGDFPAFSPEYALGARAFARNFFRLLGARITTATTIVLEDFELLPEDSPVQELLAIGVEELADRATFMILSRRGITPAFSRAQTQRRIDHIDPQQLRLTPAEALGVAEVLYPERLPPDIEEIVARCDGWIAGLILMLEYAGSQQQQQGRPPTVHAIFNYFASQVFNSFTTQQQLFLLKTSLLSEIDVALAKQLTAYHDADRFLRSLQEHHYFVELIDHQRRTYRYHGLFREFLRRKLADSLPEKEIRRLEQAVAQELFQRQEYETALRMFIHSGNWQEAIKTLHVTAETMLRVGRHHVLHHWLEKIPPEHFARDASLCLWRGQSQLPFQPNEARRWLQQAFTLFRQNENVPGIYTSWCAAAQTFFINWHQLDRLVPWIDEILPIVKNYSLPEGETAVHFFHAMISALSIANPSHPELPRWLREANRAFYLHSDPNDRAMLLGALLWHYLMAGTINRQTNLIEILSRFVDDPRIVPLHRLNLQVLYGYHLLITGELSQCRTLADRGLTLAEESGVWLFNGMFYANKAAVAILEKRHDDAGDILSQLNHKAHFSVVLTVWYSVFAAQFHIEKQEYDQAMILLWPVLDIAEKYQHLYVLVSVHVHIAMVMALQEDYEQAEAQLTAIENKLHVLDNPLVKHWYYSVQAWIADRCGRDDQCRAAIAAGLSAWRRFGANCFWLVDIMKQRLCSLAFQFGIHTDIATHMIRELRLSPCSYEVDNGNWPWPVKIHTFGGFRLEFYGQRIDIEHKGIKKPLEILKYLITAPHGTASAATLCEHLWPEKEGDKSRSAFDTSLYRLRRFLEDDSIIKLAQGNVTLDGQRCFVDLWAAEYLLQEAQQLLRTGQSERLIDVLHRLTTLYQGPFLSGEEDILWIYSVQRDFHRRVLGIAEKIGGYFEHRQCIDEAVCCYLNALRIEPDHPFFTNRLRQLRPLPAVPAPVRQHSRGNRERGHGP